MSGQYIHRTPFWINLAHEDIFKESRVSPFCIIFIEQEIVKENQKIIWAISYDVDISYLTHQKLQGILAEGLLYPKLTINI